LFETVDGGVTWTEQAELPNLGTKANVTIRAIVGCGCGDLGLVTNNLTDDEFYFYRNVDGGASGRWFRPETEAVAANKELNGLTCCGSSHFVAVGGEAATDNQVLLLR